MLLGTVAITTILTLKRFIAESTLSEERESLFILNKREQVAGARGDEPFGLKIAAKPYIQQRITTHDVDTSLELYPGQSRANINSRLREKQNRDGSRMLNRVDRCKDHVVAPR